MGGNNSIRNGDGVIENQLWKPKFDENGNVQEIAGIKVIQNEASMLRTAFKLLYL